MNSSYDDEAHVIDGRLYYKGKWYIQLPIAADGKPIDVDDSLCWTDTDGSKDYMTVAWMSYYGMLHDEPIWTLYDEYDNEADNIQSAVHEKQKSFDELMGDLENLQEMAHVTDVERMEGWDRIIPQLIIQYRKKMES